jgi:hypothetical protein
MLRAAIQNAASVAGLLITAEATVAELPNKTAGGTAMPPDRGHRVKARDGASAAPQDSGICYSLTRLVQRRIQNGRQRFSR